MTQLAVICIDIAKPNADLACAGCDVFDSETMLPVPQDSAGLISRADSSSSLGYRDPSLLL